MALDDDDRQRELRVTPQPGRGQAPDNPRPVPEPAQPEEFGSGMNDGRVRWGQNSTPIEAAQEVTSPEELPNDDRVLATTHHGLIHQWAIERGLVPVTDSAGLAGDDLGELMLVEEPGDLQEVTWTQWLTAFDERGLNFVFRSLGRTFQVHNPCVVANSAEAMESLDPQSSGYSG